MLPVVAMVVVATALFVLSLARATYLERGSRCSGDACPWCGRPDGTDRPVSWRHLDRSGSG